MSITQSAEKIEWYLYKLTYDLLIGVVEEQSQGCRSRQRIKPLLPISINMLFVGLMIEWVQQGMKEKPQAIIDSLSSQFMAYLQPP